MRHFVFAVLWLLSLPVALAAQTGEIIGRVTDQDGDAIVGAQVGIDEIARGAVTGAQGGYSLRGIPAGTYTLRVEALGHARRTDTVTVTAGATLSRDYALVREAIAVERVEVFVGSRAGHTAADELAVPVDVFPAEAIQTQGTPETSTILEELSRTAAG